MAKISFNMQEMQQKFNLFLQQMQKKIAFTVQFVENRLKNFKNITLGEQIAYPCIALGILCIFISFILFIF